MAHAAMVAGSMLWLLFSCDVFFAPYGVVPRFEVYTVTPNQAVCEAAKAGAHAEGAYRVDCVEASSKQIVYVWRRCADQYEIYMRGDVGDMH